MRATKKRGGIALPASAMLILAIPALSHAIPIDVTQPGDPILLVNGLNDGDANDGPPPAAEGVEHAIDNVTQKYLNFLDLGSGFIVTPSFGAPSGGTVVTGIRLYTANDAEPRDPASYVLEGAASAGGPFTLISNGDLLLPAGRNPGGSNPIDPSVHFHQELLFSNATAYFSYRLTFPTLKDATAANSMQIGEVELLGVAALQTVPEPSTFGLIGIGLLGLLLGARNRGGV